MDPPARAWGPEVSAWRAGLLPNAGALGKLARRWTREKRVCFAMMLCLDVAGAN